MTHEEIRKRIGSDTLGKKRNGNFLARYSYFYTNGRTPEKCAERIKTSFLNSQVEIINTYNQWKAFKGGASVANQSHFGVEFKLTVN